jgi:hypothetical protein
MAQPPNPADVRKPDRPIEPLLLRRWSPRALAGTPVSADDLATLFEAARWAPSTYNEQEWRFLYAHREGPHWATFFDLLGEGNRAWCHRAGVLVVVLSHKVFARNGKPNPVHTYDAGAAGENLALQGGAMGLVVHGMMGFDYGRARVVGVHRIRLAVAREDLVGEHHHEDAGAVTPGAIPLAQEVEEGRPVRTLAVRIEEAPFLLVVRRRRPARRLEQRGEIVGADRRTGERARRPAA